MTLGYSAQFGQALNQELIWQRLIDINKSRVNKHELRQALTILVNQKLIIKKATRYTLAGFAINFDKTSKAQKISDKYWQDARRLMTFLQKIPWVVGVAVTGSVAINCAKHQDDLDILIITSPNRLWITRLIVYTYSTLIRKKRPRGPLHRSGWCFNLWLSLDNLSIPNTKKSTYTAYDFIQANWLVASPELLKLIIKKNNWVWMVLPLAKISTSKLEITKPNQINDGLITKLLDFVNLIVYRLQKIYMRAHLTTELVDERAAFFHPNDSKTTIYTNWRKAIVFWQATAMGLQ